MRRDDGAGPHHDDEWRDPTAPAGSAAANTVPGGRQAPPPGPLPAGLDRDHLLGEVGRVLGVIPHGDSAVVAVSGGPDSTAMAHLGHEARPDLRLVLAHVRHGLRDDRADVAAVHSLAAALGLPLDVTAVTVRPTGEGVEAAARSARYGALRGVARGLGAHWLLVGHSADDQAETVLLRLARGAGVSGLGGMAPVSEDAASGWPLNIVRPLLRLRRTDVRRFVRLEGLDTVDDPTNRGLSSRRVRARLEVLPAMQRLAPDPVGALVRLADLARVDAGRLEAEAAVAAADLVRCFGPVRAVLTSALAALDPAVGGRVVQRLIAQARGAGPPQPLSAAHVAAVLHLRPGEALDLPGATITCGGGWVAAAPVNVPLAEPVALQIPGVTPWPACGISLVATVPGAAHRVGHRTSPGPPSWPPRVEVPDRLLPPGSDPALGQVVVGRVPGANDTADLLMRPRRPGDRVRTRAGTRKLQDALVDAGVPRAVRDLLPVVAAGSRPVWVPGVAVDADAVAAGRAAPVVHLAVADQADR